MILYLHSSGGGVGFGGGGFTSHDCRHPGFYAAFRKHATIIKPQPFGPDIFYI